MTRITLLFAITLCTFAGLRDASATDVVDPEWVAVQSKDFDILLQAPDADWSRYDVIHVALPAVTFRKNWQRDQNRHDSLHVRDRDVERIRDDVANLVRKVFQERLADEGWRLAVEAGPGMLVLQPDIVDLDIAAPDVPGNALRETYTDSAGSMTLDLTITDGASGAPLLKIEDHKEDPRDTYFQWRKRPNNLHRARILVRGWARELTDLLGSPEA
jgi:hypothetical protein